MNHCSYAFGFAFFAVVFVVIGRIVPIWGVSLLFFWCAVSCFLMTAAYFFQQPFWVMGKSGRKPFAVLVLLLNFPFLGAYWLVWILRHGFSRNPCVHQIANTNISISQWPIFGVSLDMYDVVFDLTSEMPAVYPVHGQYVSLPNLDGVPLCRWEIPPNVNRDQQILVHCAQGRGRSAVYAAMLLKKLDYASNAADACELIKRSRPTIHLTKAQYRELRHYYDV